MKHTQKTQNLVTTRLDFPSISIDFEAQRLPFIENSIKIFTRLEKISITRVSLAT